MKDRHLVAILASLALTAVSAVAFAGDYGYGTRQKNIVETARDAGSFSTLLTAVEAAGLGDTLAGDGPFTVFAPTDTAFAAIPADQLQALLNDKAALTEVLTYHMVSGAVTSDQVAGLSEAATVQGSTVDIKVDGERVKVDGANVVQVDIEASNGVIHVIDAVIIP